MQYTQELNSLRHTNTQGHPAIFCDCVIDEPIDVPYGSSLGLWPNVLIQDCESACFVSVLH